MQCRNCGHAVALTASRCQNCGSRAPTPVHLVALVVIAGLGFAALLQMGQCRSEVSQLADDFRAIGDR